MRARAITVFTAEAPRSRGKRGEGQEVFSALRGDHDASPAREASL
jgi:hypothetical protein